MTQLAWNLRARLGVMTAFALLTGCDLGADKAPPVANARPRLTAQDRFDRIMSELRRRIGDDGVAVAQEGAQLTGGYQLLGGDVVEPATAEGVPRATIKISEKGAFTLYNTGDDEEEEGDTEDAGQTTGDNGFSPTGANPLAGGFSAGAPTDPLLSGGATRPRGPAAAPIQTKDYDKTLEFHLTYVNERWQLDAPINKEEKGYLSEVFRIALEYQ